MGSHGTSRRAGTGRPRATKMSPQDGARACRHSGACTAPPGVCSPPAVIALPRPRRRPLRPSAATAPMPRRGDRAATELLQAGVCTHLLAARPAGTGAASTAPYVATIATAWWLLENRSHPAAGALLPDEVTSSAPQTTSSRAVGAQRAWSRRAAALAAAWVRLHSDTYCVRQWGQSSAA
jgi:hypothetical protein